MIIYTCHLLTCSYYRVYILDFHKCIPTGSIVIINKTKYEVLRPKIESIVSFQSFLYKRKMWLQNWSLMVSNSCKCKNLLLFGLLGEEDSLDVGQDTTLGNCHSRQEFVQLFVITDGKLQVTGDDPGLLVVTGSIASQLEDFGSKVLHDSSQVHWSSGTNTFSIVALAQKTVDTAHRELKTSPAAAGL